MTSDSQMPPNRSDAEQGHDPTGSDPTRGVMRDMVRSETSFLFYWLLGGTALGLIGGAVLGFAWFGLIGLALGIIIGVIGGLIFGGATYLMSSIF